MQEIFHIEYLKYFECFEFEDSTKGSKTWLWGPFQNQDFEPTRTPYVNL